MASKAPSTCCTNGFRHTGDVTGKLVTAEDIEYYVTGPESDKVLVIFTDVFGHKFQNVQLIADQFGEAGYKVVIPDLFYGDAISVEQLNSGKDLMKDWFPHHGPEQTRPIVDKVMKYVETELKPRYTVATGYCFGAKYAVQMLGEKKVQAAGIAHPSFVTIEEIKAIKGPLFISGAENDHIYSEELRAETEAALKEMGATYYTTRAWGVHHGFAVRGDPTKPAEKFAMEKCFCDWVEWFNFHDKNGGSRL
ncbi:hypothetical protein TRVA0_030S00122 [Trichomonascus vanleenenianus]|uniref:uncharacterized protein n=1 Tax=Trichomonascus vanleenenianus TaxID=2268995 RepID=UPI003ECA566C